MYRWPPWTRCRELLARASLIKSSIKAYCGVMTLVQFSVSLGQGKEEEKKTSKTKKNNE
jgi:hypothetical protein